MPGSKPKKRQSVVGERERKTENLLLRLYPSTRTHLQTLSEETGYTMSALVEYAILNLRAESIPHAAGGSRTVAAWTCTMCLRPSTTAGVSFGRLRMCQPCLDEWILP